MKLYCPVLAILFVLAVGGLTGAAVCYDHQHGCAAAGDKFIAGK